MATSGKLKPRCALWGAGGARFGEGLLCIRCIYTVFLTEGQQQFLHFFRRTAIPDWEKGLSGGNGSSDRKENTFLQKRNKRFGGKIKAGTPRF
jgi:hypothetical protein